MTDVDAAEAPADYCREIEAYLCRKNGGHLIRVVGPAFEMVCSWAARGVPLKVAFRGIDRLVERDAAKGPRRRPVRIEFCEADVLDVFDEWRRALGIAAAAVAGAGRAAEPADEEAAVGERSGRHGSLPAHLDRVLARLAAARAGSDRSLDPILDDVVQEVDAARARARGLRGDARRTLVERLEAIDRDLVAAARMRLDAATLDRLRAEAEADLSPFRTRMAGDAYERSRAASIDRLVREHLRLPIVAYE